MHNVTSIVTIFLSFPTFVLADLTITTFFLLFFHSSSFILVSDSVNNVEWKREGEGEEDGLGRKGKSECQVNNIQK